MSSTVRKQAPRLAKPAARYWKGKAPKGVPAAAAGAHSDSDSDADGEQDAAPQEPGDVSVSGEQAFEEDDEDGDELEVGRRRQGPGKMNVVLGDVKVSREGKVIVAGREESGRTAVEEEGECLAWLCAR
jgi:microfibrillar-associated protein 1